MIRRWDIFCSVVDNFGDAGVCWRLARQLASERGQQVRLWLDDLASLHMLCHEVDPSAGIQEVRGIAVQHWRPGGGLGVTGDEVADVVIEGFGVRLPEDYLAAMARRRPAPVWVNLEYLSAEDWVESHHALPSPHPTLPLTKYFFFPGFSDEAGGLLIERELAKARDAFQADDTAKAALFRGLGIETIAPATLTVSLFCYENAALPGLIDAWAQSAHAVLAVIPEGRALTQLSALTGKKFAPGDHWRTESLQAAAVPFLEQDDYDRLLWACDINFVRGEDSFVRAQLAARPMVWQAYPQSDNAHLAKVRAFLEKYGQNLGRTARPAQDAMFAAWNGAGNGGAAWPGYLREIGAIGANSKSWAQQLIAGKSLAEALENFCENKLK